MRKTLSERAGECCEAVGTTTAAAVSNLLPRGSSLVSASGVSWLPSSKHVDVQPPRIPVLSSPFIGLSASNRRSRPRRTPGLAAPGSERRKQILSESESHFARPLHLNRIYAKLIEPGQAKQAQGPVARPIPATSRHPPSNTNGQSVGPGSRPPPSTRTKLFSKSAIGRPHMTPHSRPATAMDNYATDDESSKSNRQNGTKTLQIPLRPFFPSSRRDSPVAKGLRGTWSAKSLQTPQNTASTERQCSVDLQVRGITNIGIDDPFASQSTRQRNQAVSGGQSEERWSLHAPVCGLSGKSAAHQHHRADLVLSDGKREPGRGFLAPTQTPLLASMDLKDVLLEQVKTLVMDTIKTPQIRPVITSPTKSSASFLTKNSDIRNFSAWDVDERLHLVESQFKAMKEVMDGSLTDRKRLEEVIDITKTRGRTRNENGHKAMPLTRASDRP